MPKQTAQTDQTIEAYLEVPAGSFDEYAFIIQQIRKRYPSLRLESSLELREPRIYITRERRLFVGAATLRSLFAT